MICSACGDGDAAKRNKLDGRVLCDECYEELAFGRIPKVEPVRFGQGTGNVEQVKHDMEYHGGRSNGEW